MTDTPIIMTPVRTRWEVERFLRVPHPIYRSDPHWIPPLLIEGRRLLSRRRNAFFEHGEANFWIARRGGKPVGRISAQINRTHLDLHKDATGNFGFFEAIDDQAVVDTLVGTAERWLRERGMKRILGPYSPSINDEIGILIDGFDRPPFIGMAHAPRYYAERLERSGYRKAKDVFAFLLDETCLRGNKLGEMRKLLDRPYDDARLNIRPFQMSRFSEEMREGISIYNDAWADNWGFVPVTPREIDKVIENIRMIVRPEAMMFGELDGERVAILVALPNVNEALRDIGGRLLPFGWLKLLNRRWTERCHSVRVVLMGVRRKHRDSRVGMALLGRMIGAIAEQAIKRGIRSAELSWILEDNRASIGICRLVGGIQYKTYRIFQKSL